MSHKMIHVPEPDEPTFAFGGEVEHECKPRNDIDSSRSAIRVKHRSIAECRECGQLWWANVFGRYNSYSGKTLYHVEWHKLRWYHYKLKRYTK